MQEKNKKNLKNQNIKLQPLSRRDFLTKLGIGVAGLGIFKNTALIPVTAEAATSSTTTTAGAAATARAKLVKSVRQKVLDMNLKRTFPKNPNPTSKDKAPYIENFTKGLPHNDLGEVDQAAYKALLKAINSGRLSDFERLRLGGSKKLKNPLASYCIQLDSNDNFQYKFSIAPPKISSPTGSAEMAELYWMSECRDISFSDYASSVIIASAAQDLNRFAGAKYPRDGLGNVTSDNIFRFGLSSDLTGPYISQFLYQDINQGPFIAPQRYRTVVPNKNYLTEYTLWKFTQDGNLTGIDEFDPVPRYIRNGRDLAEVMHNDRFPSHFSNAALIAQFGYKAHKNPGHPYVLSDTMDGFATFDYPHLQAILAEVMKLALQAEFVRKWVVWRKLRPEAYGGLVHNKIIQNTTHNINTEIFGSSVLDRVFSKYGTYLLPQQFPEGSPGHPSYGSGHSVYAGACATILKMWFDETSVLPGPVVANADGTALIDYTGPGAGLLTLGGEINKLAFNTAVGRLWGGIHYRSDMIEGLRLGEEVAIAYMQSQRFSFTEKYSFTFTRFDGRTVRIRN